MAAKVSALLLLGYWNPRIQKKLDSNLINLSILDLNGSSAHSDLPRSFQSEVLHLADLHPFPPFQVLRCASLCISSARPSQSSTGATNCDHRWKAQPVNDSAAIFCAKREQSARRAAKLWKMCLFLSQKMIILAIHGLKKGYTTHQKASSPSLPSLSFPSPLPYPLLSSPSLHEKTFSTRCNSATSLGHPARIWPFRSLPAAASVAPGHSTRFTVLGDGKFWWKISDA